MAPKLLVKNNRGQGLIETTFLLALSGVFLYLLLQCLLKVLFTVAFESMAEDYFFCELAKKQACLQRLETRLRQNQVREVEVRSERKLHKIILTVSGLHVSRIKITREFDYEKFNEKF